MEHSWIMPALSGFLLMVAMAQFALTRIERSRRRQGELDQVRDLLPRHYDALDRMNDAEQLPQDLKDVASWVSSGIEDQATARFFVEHIFLRGDGRARDLGSDEFAGLRAAHPAAMQDYDLAISTGLVASVLKWPETARQAERVMAEFLSARQEETASAFRAAKEQGRRPKQPSLAGA